VIGNAAQDAFINRNKWAVVTTLRGDGSPSSSVVFYAREGDDLLFSTTATRLKARTLERDDRIALTALDEGAPYGFVTVEGRATVQRDDIVPGHRLILKAMRGPDAEPPEGYEERLAKEGRVIVRVRAERVSGVPERG
jgi:PPOX class probable F420-dependent enzyme